MSKKANNSEIINEIEERADFLGMSPGKLFKKSGLAPSQFYRWKNNETSPTYNSVTRIKQTINILVKRREERGSFAVLSTYKSNQ